MPTGYTAFVQDNPDCSFSDFAWRCARAMGFCVMQRDDSLEAGVNMDERPSDFYKRSLDEAKAERDRIELMTDEQWQAEESARAESAARSLRESQAKRTATVEAYRRMLAMVEEWSPPPEIVGMQDFMREQLTESIRFDGPFDEDESTRRIFGATGRTRYAALAELDRRVAQYSEEYSKEVDRVNERNRYKRLLKESLEQFEPSAV